LNALSRALVAITIVVLAVNAFAALTQELIEAPLYYEADLNNDYLLLIASIRITEFHDYSYFYIALDSLDRGIYNYGFIVLKDPDESHPTIYLIHSPSNWTNVGLVVGSEVELLLLVDRVENKIYYVVLNAKGEVSVEGIGRVFGISIISDSVSRDIPKPKVFLEKAEVAGCNNTEVKDLFKRGEYLKISDVCEVKIKLPQETTATPPIATLEESSSLSGISGDEGIFHSTLKWVIILIIVATTAAALVIYVRRLGSTINE